MKRIMILLFLCFAVQVLHAQTIAEWFQQKKTQIKYLVEQIGALKVYAGYLEKGYSIAKEGINTINDIKHGDFFLHEGHFDSLKIVNPVIAASFYVADAVVLATKIEAAAKAGTTQVLANDFFMDAEKEYLQRVYNNIINGAAADLDQLTTFIMDGELQMTDDERLQNIKVMYASLQDKYAFVQSFSKQAQMLSVQRIKQQSETDRVKKLYNIK
ncbi:hypothetical protein FRZ67_18905 [Panacibacter ginsenosidivorans]|uniref:TerB family tellurite resistance protein n=1 Tax=Panacibacter ginsenosidivorans TaxID=1813871 RepID=A0A5B8VG15_9BACT|nr:hypothetical protein [Panacibacter ginsenosidivorans]QEC69278.1 hypothetical protein FRZ67_18905 [Panacibacter ginsenosidivorans]